MLKNKIAELMNEPGCATNQADRKSTRLNSSHRT